MLSSINALQIPTSRPRSTTASSANLPNSSSPNDASHLTIDAQRVRPPHLRSRSYISSVEAKSRYGLTAPIADSLHGTATQASRGWEREKESDKEKAESSHRPWKHLPGHRRHGDAEDDKSSHLLSQRRSHRYTRSELPSHSKSGGSGAMSTGDDAGGGGGVTRTSTEDSHLHPTVAGLKTGMLTRISTNLSSRNPYTHPHGSGQQRANHQYSNSDMNRGWTPAAHTAAGRPDLRRRATSDPKAPLQRYSSSGHIYTGENVPSQFIGYGAGGGAMPLHDYRGLGDPYRQLRPETKPMTEIEILLYKADKARRESEANITEMDVQWLTTQLAESNVELQLQLARNDRTASDLTRRLDDAHDALLETASSLSDTISSFQNLVTQSKSLGENFEQKAKELDSTMREILQRRKGELLDARGERVAKLEKRGTKANQKAEQLSQRLENCRTIVRNFQEREQTKRKAWKGVLMGSLWGVSLIVFGLMLGFGIWWWKNYKDIVIYDVHEAVALAVDRKALDHSYAAAAGGAKVKVKMNETERVKVLENVPDDVRLVLQDIARRHDAAVHPSSKDNDDGDGGKTQQFAQPSSEAQVEEDKKLKKLFEKLEL